MTTNVKLVDNQLSTTHIHVTENSQSASEIHCDAWCLFCEGSECSPNENQHYRYCEGLYNDKTVKPRVKEWTAHTTQCIPVIKLGSNQQGWIQGEWWRQPHYTPPTTKSLNVSLYCSISNHFFKFLRKHLTVTLPASGTPSRMFETDKSESPIRKLWIHPCYSQHKFSQTHASILYCKSKTRHHTSAHNRNFAKCLPIFIILALTDSPVNLQ